MVVSPRVWWVGFYHPKDGLDRRTLPRKTVKTQRAEHRLLQVCNPLGTGILQPFQIFSCFWCLARSSGASTTMPSATSTCTSSASVSSSFLQFPPVSSGTRWSYSILFDTFLSPLGLCLLVRFVKLEEFVALFGGRSEFLGQRIVPQWLGTLCCHALLVSSKPGHNDEDGTGTAWNRQYCFSCFSFTITCGIMWNHVGRDTPMILTGHCLFM